MFSRYQYFLQLKDFRFFANECQSRVDVFNRTMPMIVAMGDDIDYVHSQWVKVIEARDLYRSEPLLTLVCQDVLGELCHALARFDVFLLAKPLRADVAGEDNDMLRFIGEHIRQYMAVDICTAMYRKIMPFGPDDYPKGSLFVLRRLCAEMKDRPTRGRSFIRALQYPTTFKGQ